MGKKTSKDKIAEQAYLDYLVSLYTGKKQEKSVLNNTINENEKSQSFNINQYIID